MNSEKSILKFMKVYNINSPEGLQNKRSEDATLSVGDIVSGTATKSASKLVPKVKDEKPETKQRSRIKNNCNCRF